MGRIISRGKERVMSNDGRVQLNINDNRILHYDNQTYRFIIGDKPNDGSKVVMSKEGENVLNV